MKKNKTNYLCGNCKYVPSQWIGRCPECGEWNTIIEYDNELSKQHNNKLSIVQQNRSKKISDLIVDENSRLSTNIFEFDRALGGGLVVGSLTLIGGDPGIGKSTLMLKILDSLCAKYKNEKLLYISGEESLNQIVLRSNRLKNISSNLYIFNETHWSKIKLEIEQLMPKLIVIDSIQMIVSSEVNSAAGSINQIKEITYELLNIAKASNITCIAIGHITKDGAIAGPKVLEHMVDTVLYFEGKKESELRILRPIKNRFGSTNEIGLFKMEKNGLNEIVNLDNKIINKKNSSFGVTKTYSLQGTRGIFSEVQALVIENKLGTGQRIVDGISKNRLTMLLAIIEKYLNIPLSHNDVYVDIIGDIKSLDREVDLAIIAAIVSSQTKTILDGAIIFLGEVSLTGEVSSSSSFKLKFDELSRLGQYKIVTSTDSAKKFKNLSSIEINGIKNINELFINYLS